jgi:hypothetical protein
MIPTVQSLPLDSTPEPHEIDDLNLQIITLESNLKSMTNNADYHRNHANDYRIKIDNVRGYIMDEYSMEGSISTHLEEVARLLDIQLTKRISGKMTIEVEYFAEVPLGFDECDLDLSFSVECDSHDVEGFEYNEILCDWTVEEDA